MNIYIILAFSLLATFKGAGNVEIGEAQSLDLWEKHLDQLGISNDITMITSFKVKIPQFHGDYLSNKQKNQGLERKKKVIFSKIKKIIIESFVNVEDLNIAYINNLFELEEKLKKEKGYKNKALSISVAGLAGWCAVKRALSHPKEAKKLYTLLQNRNEAIAYSPLETMKIFVVEDQQLAKQTLLIRLVLDSDEVKQAQKVSSFTLYLLLQKKLPEDLRPPHFALISTKKLFDSPSIYKLETLESYVESKLKSQVPGLLRFIEKGGDVKTLNPRSVTEFHVVMGQERWNYRFSYLNIQSLRPSMLLGLVGEVVQVNARLTILKRLRLTN